MKLQLDVHLSIVSQAKKHLSNDLSKIKSCIKLNWFCKFN